MRRCLNCNDPLKIGPGYRPDLELCNVCRAEATLLENDRLPSESQIYGVLVHETATRRNAARLMTDGREWNE